MISSKLTDDDRQIVAVHETCNVIADFVIILVYLVHVHAEHGVIQRVCVSHLGCAIKHSLLPILSPVGSIYHQGVRQIGIANGLNRRTMLIDPGAGSLIIAKRLIAYINQHKVFLAS